jgi:chlorite dismutase
MAERSLSLFATFRGTAGLWELDGRERKRVLEEWGVALAGAAERVETYAVYPGRGEADLLVWAASGADEAEAPGGAFTRWARAMAPFRRWLEPGMTAWGMTRPSEYVRRESSTAIDAVGGERLPYLVVYPFVKTHEWFRLDGEERRRSMGEHIRVGRQYGDVSQLLLYSFGLQDQDFVVVYETRDLARFSALVHELRATEARAFTARDTPIHTAVHLPGGAADLLAPA